MANPTRIKIEPLMGFEETGALIDLVKLVACPNMKVLEIGTGQGGSALLMYGEVIRHYEGTLFTIDIKVARGIIPISENCKGINFMIGRSEDFLKILSPFVEFDLIFIDGSHLYQDVLSDIQLSLPLVKEGGILCGHDCDVKYMGCTPEQQKDIDAHIHDNKCGFCHAGVTRALYDVFQDRYERHQGTRVWHVKK